MLSRTIAILGLAGYWAVLQAAGLDGASAQTGPTAAVAELTTADVQAALARVEQSPDLPPEIRKQLVESYNAALEELRRAEDWWAKAAAHESARQAAPAELEAIRAELSQAPDTAGGTGAAPETSLEALKQMLGEAEAGLATAQQEQGRLQTQLRRRPERIEEVRVLDAAARQRLEELHRQLAVFGPAEALSPMDRAQRTLLVAARQRLENERRAYERELPSYEATRELLRARLDRATRNVNLAQQRLAALKQEVAERSRIDAARKADDARWAVLTARPELLPLAQENQRLAALRSSPEGPSALAKTAEQQVAALSERLDKLSAQFADVQQVAHLSATVGQLLQRQLEELPDVTYHRSRIRGRQAEIAAAKLRLIELENRRSELADVGAASAELLAGFGAGLAADERAEVEAAARELLATQRDTLDALIADYNRYFNLLVLELDKTEQELINATVRYDKFIREQILWIRNFRPLEYLDPASLLRAAGWWGEPGRWLALAGQLADDARDDPLPWAAVLLVFAAWLLLGRRFRRRIIDAGVEAEKRYTVAMRPTFQALLLTILVAAVWPALLAMLAWRLSATLAASVTAHSIAFGLYAAAGLLLPLELLRQVCRRHGLAESHFQWSAGGLRVARRNLRWLVPVVLPLAFVAAAVEHQENEIYRASLGRLAFVAAMLALAAFARRTFEPRTGLLTAIRTAEYGEWSPRVAGIWQAAAVLAPLALAVAAAAGYYYTALVLAGRLIATAVLLFALLVVHGLLLRWLLLARRKLAIKQARERRAAALAHGQERSGEAAAEEAAIPLSPAPAIDLASIDAQTRRLLRSFVNLALLVGAWLIWAEVLPALNILNQWELWRYDTTVTLAQEALEPAAGDGQPGSALVKQTDWITLGDVVLAAVVVLMTLIAGRNLPGLMEIAFLQRLPLDAGGRYAVTTVTRYLIQIVGLFVGLALIGITWSSVQWLAAAITVGLGFGLQEIFANFVSGLIILFERPMRVGDVVTVGDVTGTVTRIRARATTITDWDRKELIVPNREFITGRLLNWTLSNTINRITIQVGTAYGSDTERARELLLGVARRHPNILDDPPPVATFEGFGDSTLNLVLRCYLPSLENRLATIHELHTAIDREFRAAGIEIAFPQRDLHVRRLDPEVLALVGGAAREARHHAAPHAPASPASDRAASPLHS